MKQPFRKRRFGSSFVLTLEEKKVICFILLAFVLGLVTKHYREKESLAASPAITESAEAKRSVSPIKAIRKKEPARERKSNQ